MPDIAADASLFQTRLEPRPRIKSAFVSLAWQQPFRGYYYRILTKQGADARGGAKDYVVNGKMTGGFAFIAYPEKYGDTGIASFIVNQNSIVYEKDLRRSTNEAVLKLTEFNPDKSWTAVPE